MHTVLAEVFMGPRIKSEGDGGWKGPASFEARFARASG